MLTVRPRPIPGESWASWLRVCAHENKYESASYFVRLFGHHATFPTCTQRDLLRLLAFDPADFPEADEPGPNIDGRVPTVRARHARVCPSCLKDGLERLPSVWDLPLSISCEKHAVYLIDICHRCGSHLDPFRPLAKFCACGADLGANNAVPAGPWVIDLARLSATDSIEARGRTFARATDRETLSFLALRMIGFGLIGPEKFGKTGWPDIEHISALESLISPWPNSLVEATKTMLRQRWARRRSLYGYAKQLPGDEMLAAIREARRSVERPPPKARQDGWRDTASRPLFKEAMQVLDVPEPTLIRWLKQIHFARNSPEKLSRRRRTRGGILRELIDEYGRSIGVDAAVRYSGLSSLTLRTIANAGEFSLDECSLKTRCYFQKKLASFCERLVRLARPFKGDQQEFIPFTAVSLPRQGCVEDARRMRQVLSLVRARKLPVFYLVRADAGVSSLGFSASDLARQVASWRRIASPYS